MPFQIVDSVCPGSPTGNVRSAAMDRSRDSIYFGCTHGAAAQGSTVLGVNLSSFTISGTIVIPSAGSHDYLTVGFAHPEAGYAYFGHMLARHLYKIDLDAFVVNDTLDLSGVLPGRIWGAGVIDLLRSHAYVGNYNVAAGRITKIDLSTFGIVDTLDPGIQDMFCAVIDEASGLAYFGGSSLVKVEIDPGFVVVDTLDIGADFTGATIDLANQLAYFTHYTGGTPGGICRVDLASFTITDDIATPLTFVYSNPAVFDSHENYAYFGSMTLPNRLAVVRLSDFVHESTLRGLDPVASTFLGGAVIDTGSRSAYFGGAQCVWKLSPRQVSQTYFFLA